MKIAWLCRGWIACHLFTTGFLALVQSMKTSGCLSPVIPNTNVTSSSLLTQCFKVPMKLGHAVAQLIEALRYKAESRGFNSRWSHWDFSFSGHTMALGSTHPLT
jgi:hypothetical protein